MNIIIYGETPSKKNSRINTRSGRSFPSKRYMEWHDDAIKQIAASFGGKIPVMPKDKRVRISVVFYHGDLVNRDGDNQYSSIVDMLKDAKIIKDDNWKVLKKGSFDNKYDKGNARCVISLEVI